MTKLQILRGFVTSLLFGAGAVHADSVVNVHGTVTTIPCIVTDNSAGIIVDFKDVFTTRIDGAYKLTQIVLRVECDDIETDTPLKVTVTGEPAGFGSGYLATNIEGLGMKFLDGLSTQVPVNTGAYTYYYHSNKNRALYVVPVKDPSVELPGGPFMSTATLTIDYP